MRILVAEDDAALRSVLERGLNEHGYVVDPVADGEQALGFLRTYEYEVAIIDWRMPKVSGLDVVRALRAQALGAANLDAHGPGHGFGPCHGAGRRRRRLPGEAVRLRGAAGPAARPAAPPTDAAASETRRWRHRVRPLHPKSPGWAAEPLLTATELAILELLMRTLAHGGPPAVHRAERVG